MKLLIVFCWHGDSERIERHEPYWKRSGCELLYSFPWDAPLRNRPGFCHERSQQYGEGMIGRHVATLRYALTMGAEAVYCTEADSICLGSAPDPFADAVGGYVFPDNNERFRAKSFTHWAWSFSRPILKRFVEAAEKDWDARTELFPDRWLSWVCERHGIPLRHDERVFSRNQFDTPELVTEARQAVARGCWHLHGTKTAEQLRDVLL